MNAEQDGALKSASGLTKSGDIPSRSKGGAKLQMAKISLIDISVNFRPNSTNDTPLESSRRALSNKCGLHETHGCGPANKNDKKWRRIWRSEAIVSKSDCSAASINGSVDSACDQLAKKGLFVEFGCVVAETLMFESQLGWFAVAEALIVKK